LRLSLPERFLPSGVFFIHFFLTFVEKCFRLFFVARGHFAHSQINQKKFIRSQISPEGAFPLTRSVALFSFFFSEPNKPKDPHHRISPNPSAWLAGLSVF
jgi:hypothetical protein